MSQTCDACGTVVFRRRYMAEQKRWLGYDCGCLAADWIPKSCANPFDLTLDHVYDEFGQRLHVSSIRELSAAETRLGFQHVVLNQDRQNWDDPPQQRSVTMSDIVKRKFSQVRERYT